MVCFYVSVCLSAINIREPLNGFWRNLVLEKLTKSYRQFVSVAKIGGKMADSLKTNFMRLHANMEHKYLLGRKMFRTQVVEKADIPHSSLLLRHSSVFRNNYTKGNKRIGIFTLSCHLLTPTKSPRRSQEICSWKILHLLKMWCAKLKPCGEYGVRGPRDIRNMVLFVIGATAPSGRPHSRVF